MILVTGATGLVGSHLLCTLLEQGKAVRAIFRDSNRIDLFNAMAQYYPEAHKRLHKVDWVQADLLDLSSLSRACEGIRHIYHAAAYISFDPSEHSKLRKINIEGTANLINVALNNGVESLCHISSVATLGEPLNNAPISETTEWNPAKPGSAYAISKYGAEMEVWRGAQEGLKVSMVLPGVILGEGFWDSPSGSLIPRAAKGLPFYTGGGSGFVDVKDVVRAAILTSNTEKAQGQKYLLVGANITYKDFFTQLAAYLGNKAPKRQAPKWLLHVLAFLDGIRSKLSSKPRELSQDLVHSLYDQELYSSSKIEQELKFEFTPISETLERICTAFNEWNP